MANTEILLKDLFYLFHEIRSGTILVPSFQRSFVWRRQDIIKLIDSVYHGYPIGMLLFLESSELLFKSKPFFQIPETLINRRASSRRWYVIDGFQRLMTLYSTLYLPREVQPEKFRISFNLKTKEFQPLNPAKMDRNVIDISNLFAPDTYFEQQMRQYDDDVSKEFVSQLNAIYHAFSIYQIPISLFSQIDTDGVIEVFERINARGLTLSRNEVARIRQDWPANPASQIMTYFRVLHGRPKGEYRFQMESEDGRVLLYSEGFDLKGDALRHIEIVRRAAGNPRRFLRTITNAGNHRFLLRSVNGRVIAESPEFESQEAMEDALNLVSRNALISKMRSSDVLHRDSSKTLGQSGSTKKRKSE